MHHAYSSISFYIRYLRIRRNTQCTEFSTTCTHKYTHNLYSKQRQFPSKDALLVHRSCTLDVGLYTILHEPSRSQSICLFEIQWNENVPFFYLYPFRQRNCKQWNERTTRQCAWFATRWYIFSKQESMRYAKFTVRCEFELFVCVRMRHDEAKNHRTVNRTHLSFVCNFLFECALWAMRLEALTHAHCPLLRFSVAVLSCLCDSKELKIHTHTHGIQSYVYSCLKGSTWLCVYISGEGIK